MSHKTNDIWDENLVELKNESSPLTQLNELINQSQDETIKNLNKINQILDSMTSNKCNFCDSTDTTKYPAEGEGDVYLCEDCRAIGSEESADR